MTYGVILFEGALWQKKHFKPILDNYRERTISNKTIVHIKWNNRNNPKKGKERTTKNRTDGEVECWQDDRF